MAATGRRSKRGAWLGRQGSLQWTPRRRCGAMAALLILSCALVWSATDGLGREPAQASADQTSVAVTLIADGAERAVTTPPVTVAEVLASAGVALGELDRVELSETHRPLRGSALEQVVGGGEVVRVVRVTRERVTREIEIPVETRVRYDRRVHRTVTLSEGAPGRASAVLEIWTRDGEETQRTVISQRVIEPMQPQTVVRGGASAPARGGEVMYMVATAYDPGPRSCGRYASGRTAIGLRAGKGVVAVDPRVIPLGTRLYVEGYGECIAGDVGSAIKGRRIDLGFDTYREAIRWGRRTVRVHILD